MNYKKYCAITGKLTFNTALHIGTGRGDVGADSPLRRTVSGELFLPGTAIAGALRSLATRLAVKISLGSKNKCDALLPAEKRPSKKICGCTACHLFGEVNPQPTNDEKKGGRASRLWVYDARLIKSPQPYIRDGVGIDRLTGTAARAAKVKFDTEVLPKSACFALHLELEDTNEHDQLLLAAALAEWQAGRAWLGGNISRGLGQATLSEVKCFHNELKTASDLLKFLSADEPINSAQEDKDWLSKTVDEARETQKSASPEIPFIEASFLLTFDGPFVTNDSTAAGAIGFDHVPLLDGVPGFKEKLNPVLPGSGLRGALRSHAERIARTIATFNAHKNSPDNRKKAFLEHCPACNPVEDRADQPLTRCDKLIEKSPASDTIKENPDNKHLCLACRLFGSTLQGSRLRVADAPLVGEPQWKPIDFLAIDRFTGGGLDGAKFDAMTLWRPTFSVHLFLEEPKELELGWLALVLRDLADGLIPIGFGAAKGFGCATIDAIKIQGGFLKDDDWGVSFKKQNVVETPGFYRTAAYTAADWPALEKTVKSWIGKFHDELNDVERDQQTRPTRDSYFGEVDQLYPLMEVGDE